MYKKNSIELLDGGMGSEFIKRGIHLPKNIWSAQLNLEAQELIHQIHKEYVGAGSNYLTTNTFRTTPRAYLKTGLLETEAKDIAKLSLKSAVNIAKNVAEGRAKVLGSIAPLEDCYSPEMFPGEDIAKNEFEQLAKWFNEVNVDIFLLETMNSITETKTAIESILRYNIPIWVSFVLLDADHILSGETLLSAIEMLKDYSIECLLLNCNSLEKTDKALNIVNKNWPGKWGIYPNLGLGDPSSDGNITKMQSDDKFLTTIKAAINSGAIILGGCCGSSPRHIKLLKTNFLNVDVQ